MADTIDDIAVPNQVWLDLYDESGITPGTAVDIINKGSNPCLLCISAAEPASDTIGMPLYSGPVGSYAHIDAGESGLWAYCADGTTSLLLQE